MFIRDLYEAPAKRIVAVMPGGFHPFHPGHKSLYDWAVKTFGQGNVYVAATNDTAARPFPFDVKKKLAGMAGIPESNFIQVKSPFNAMSYQDIVDDATALVFVRSEKDKAEHPKPDQTKKNGEPGYLRTYTGKDLNSSNEMGYMAYGPTVDFDFSGMQIKSASELRATWPNMSDEDKHKAAALMYGNGHDEAVQLLDKALGGSDAPVEDQVTELKVLQQRPKIDVLTNIAVRKDSTPFPLSYKDTGDNTASTGGKIYIGPKDAAKFIKFYDTRAEDEQSLMQKALKSITNAEKLFTNLGIQVKVEPSNYNESDKDLDENPLVRFALQKAAGAIARKGGGAASTAGAGYIGTRDRVKQAFKSDNKSNHTVGSARAPGASGYTKPGDETNGLDALAASQKNRSKRIKKEDGTDGVTGQTVRAMARLKARYPHADSDLELMLAAITDNKNLIKTTDFDNDEEADDLAARLDKIEKTVKNMKSKKESVKEADVVVDKSSLVPYIKNLIMDYLDKEQDVEKLSKLLKMMVGREIKTRGGKRYTITRKDIDEALQKNG